MVINVDMTHAIISSNKYVSTTNDIVSLSWDIKTISLIDFLLIIPSHLNSVLSFRMESYLNQFVKINGLTALLNSS